jgi:small subunit ribosomal protein S16
MAVHIRLARHGTKKAPYYRIVVTDQRNARDGRFIENIGLFDPRVGDGKLDINKDRYSFWTQRGAQASLTVKRLFKAAPVTTG